MRSARSGLDIVAWLISAVLSPFVVFAVLIGVFISRAAVGTEHFLYWSAITLVLTASIPAFYIFWQVRLGKISDPHIEQHKQRQSVFGVFILSLLLGTLVLWKFGAPHSFVVLTLLIFVNSLLAGLITIYWKISIHSWVIAGALSIMWLTTRFNIWFLISALVVPVMIWSRVYRKRHTLAQAIAGALAGGVTTLVIYLYIIR